MSEPRRPNPILARLGTLLEIALNRALALDQETRQRLAALDGRAVSISFTGTPLALRLTVERDILRVGPAFAGDSALRLAASPFTSTNTPRVCRRGSAVGSEPSIDPANTSDSELPRNSIPVPTAGMATPAGISTRASDA